MSQASTVERVSKSRFFKNVAPEHHSGLEAICREVEIPARTTIFEEYDRAKDVYVITSGEVSLVICEGGDVCRQIAVVGEEDILGWSPLLGRTRLFDTAVTLTPVKALVFDGKQLMDFCAKNPSFGFEFMRKAAAALATRLSGTRMQLLQMCGNSFPTFEMHLEND